MTYSKAIDNNFIFSICASWVILVINFKWATTRMRLRASLHCVFSILMCFLNERCESHHSPRNFVDSSTGRSVFPILTMGGLWAPDRGAVKCMTLYLWAANLKPFLVAHSCMAFTACCRCLSMVSRKRPRKQIARSSTKCFEDVLGNTRGQLINLQSKTCHSKDTASWNTFLWVEFVRVLSQFWLGFAGLWDILTQKQAVCLWGQSCEGLGWCHIARLSHRLFPSQRRDQLPVASEQRHPGHIFQGSPMLDCVELSCPGPA